MEFLTTPISYSKSGTSNIGQMQTLFHSYRLMFSKMNARMAQYDNNERQYYAGMAQSDKNERQYCVRMTQTITSPPPQVSFGFFLSMLKSEEKNYCSFTRRHLFL